MPQAAGAMFQLHPAFPATSEPVGDLTLCHVRLQADARWPWLILIPRLLGLRELEDLSTTDRSVLMAEIVGAGVAVRAMGQALGWPVEKLNVGQLGNLTPQLHIHVVGRRPGDTAWPGPVWGLGVAIPRDREALVLAIAAARAALDL
jgi:diadenosine tetraphosphate (Ap4A) HIT family hydrolase